MSKENQFIVKRIVQGNRSPQYLDTYTLGDRNSQVFKDAVAFLHRKDAQQEMALEDVLSKTEVSAITPYFGEATETALKVSIPNALQAIHNTAQSIISSDTPAPVINLGLPSGQSGYVGAGHLLANQVAKVKSGWSTEKQVRWLSDAWVNNDTADVQSTTAQTITKESAAQAIVFLLGGNSPEETRRRFNNACVKYPSIHPDIVNEVIRIITPVDYKAEGKALAKRIQDEYKDLSYVSKFKAAFVCHVDHTFPVVAAAIVELMKEDNYTVGMIREIINPSVKDSHICNQLLELVKQQRLDEGILPDEAVYVDRTFEREVDALNTLYIEHGIQHVISQVEGQHTSKEIHTTRAATLIYRVILDQKLPPVEVITSCTMVEELRFDLILMAFRSGEDLDAMKRKWTVESEETIFRAIIRILSAIAERDGLPVKDIARAIITYNPGLRAEDLFQCELPKELFDEVVRLLKKDALSECDVTVKIVINDNCPDPVGVINNAIDDFNKVNAPTPPKLKTSKDVLDYLDTFVLYTTAIKIKKIEDLWIKEEISLALAARAIFDLKKDEEYEYKNVDAMLYSARVVYPKLIAAVHSEYGQVFSDEHKAAKLIVDALDNRYSPLDMKLDELASLHSREIIEADLLTRCVLLVCGRPLTYTDFLEVIGDISVYTGIKNLVKEYFGLSDITQHGIGIPMITLPLTTYPGSCAVPEWRFNKIIDDFKSMARPYNREVLRFNIEGLMNSVSPIGADYHIPTSWLDTCIDTLTDAGSEPFNDRMATMVEVSGGVAQEITGVCQTAYYRNDKFEDYISFSSAPGVRTEKELIGVLCYEMPLDENDPECIAVTQFDFFYQGDSVFITDRYGNTVDRLR